jgi:hypothetical protein
MGAHKHSTKPTHHHILLQSPFLETTMHIAHTGRAKRASRLAMVLDAIDRPSRRSAGENADPAEPTHGVLSKRIVNAMTVEVDKYGLRLMQHYPDDLLVHDRKLLDQMAQPCAHLALVIGDTHTHIVAVGIHPRENESIDCLLALAATDRFYDIRIAADGATFDMREIGREAFSELRDIMPHYARHGETGDCWLVRDDTRIGQIRVQPAPPSSKVTFVYTLTPTREATPLDRYALEVWAGYDARAMAQSLLFTNIVEWRSSTPPAALDS